MKSLRKNIHSSSRSPSRLLILVLVLLTLSNIVLGYLYLKERSTSKNMAVFVERAKVEYDQIYESLRQKDLQRAFRHLNEAQNQVLAFLPAPPGPTSQPQNSGKGVQPAQSVQAVHEKVVSPPQPSAQVVPSPPQGMPSPFVFAETGDHFLMCEKDMRTLSLYTVSAPGKVTLVKQYPCVVGANNYNKERDGDFATPVGVYFFLRFAPGSTLPENYGYGAYVMNYPNFLDRREGKKGGGIWLHGHSPSKVFGSDVVDTKGCIVVSNEALKELSTFLKPSGTPIVIVKRLQFVKQEDYGERSKELRNFLNSWKQSWESINTKKYLSYYSPHFINSEGMNFNAFKKHKEKTNKTKKFIQVKIENLAIFMSPEHGENVAVARFLQRYNSNNFKSDTNKIFYLQKGQSGWHIIGESSY